jgi:hypothetical protein
LAPVSRQFGKTFRIVSVQPVIPTAPVAQTFPAVTVDRFGQSFFLTVMPLPSEIVAASGGNLGNLCVGLPVFLAQ